MGYWSKIKSEVKVNFTILAFLAGTPAQAKMSLGVQFPEIVMEKVELGQAYNLRQLKGIPYIVMNKSDMPLNVEVEVQVPQDKDLKEGYEAIPDPAWLRILPNKFHMEPGDVMPSDVILAVPADSAFSGRHFQAFLFARSKGAGMLQVGVKHMVRFSVGVMGPDTLKKESQADTLLSLNVDLSPQTLQVMDVPLGKPVDLLKDKKLGFKLSNLGDKPFTFKLTSVNVDSRYTGGLSHEPTPNPAWLEVKTPKIQTKPNRIEDVRLVLNVPDVPENRGRKLLFVVSIELDRKDMPFQMIGKVLATMRQ